MTSKESLFISVFPKTMVSTLLSVNIFTGFPSFMGARGITGITIHITESKIKKS
jgi:hypothetical protein